MTDPSRPPMTRRDLLALIGAAAGGTVMYQAMTSLGHAAESNYRPLALDGDAKGASVVILGAGLAGMVAAYELRKVGYKVKLLEYSDRAGGRCWSVRGGDRYTELGGATQACAFDAGHYLNPGPWRIPYHHHAILDYCRRLKVALEPFTQVNYNAFLHSKDAFGGKPQRYRAVAADFNGGVAELIAKAAHQGKLDDAVGKEDQEILLEALRSWGGLDRNFAYVAGDEASERRGWDADPGGGPGGAPTPSTPVGLSDILKSRLWQGLAQGGQYEFQSTMFQPKGGMDMIAKAFARELGPLIRYHAKVTAIRQDEYGVTVVYQDTKAGGAPRHEVADWCVCTIPLSILDQIELTVGPKMAAAIAAVPYVPAVKIGLQFKRRFWEEDEAIYGGITTTDLPIRNIGYPNADYGSPGKGVLLGCYAIFNTFAFEFGSLPPSERVAKAVEWGAMIHPQYRAEFESGVAVAWQRNPASLGCFANWSEEARKTHYADLCAIDGRMVLAGEHASYLPAWQEGAILSSLDAVARLHRRVVAG
jgi:monoamine oxidase